MDLVNKKVDGAALSTSLGLWNSKNDELTKQAAFKDVVHVVFVSEPTRTWTSARISGVSHVQGEVDRTRML